MLALGAGTALGYVVLLVAAVAPAPVVFCLAALTIAALEGVAGWRVPFLAWATNRLGVGPSWRGVVRAVAALVLVERGDVGPRWFVTAFVALAVVVLLRTIGVALAELVQRQRKMPVVTRGLPLASVQIPRAPHPLLGRHLHEVLGCPDVLLVAGAGVAVLADTFAALVVGAVATILVLAAAVGALAWASFAMLRLTKLRFTAAVQEALDALSPEVALYFGGRPDTLYQLETWIEAVERLEIPAVVILRDRETLMRLGPTRLPVLCIERSMVLMGLPLPRLRVALYVAHATNNLHMLRRSGVRHVFLGHGDSDKSVTTNPFLRAYDEIWVAGPAARDRFTSAGLNLDHVRILEIGRPQLDALTRLERLREATPRPAYTAGVATEATPTPTGDGRGPAGKSPLTVLYAPTWEGYGDEPYQSSLARGGVALVRMLLAQPDVRIIYRQHPLTGSRDPAVARAHQEILQLLGAPVPPEPVAPAEPYVGARDDLEVAGSPVYTSRAEQVAALDIWASQHLAPAGPSTASTSSVAGAPAASARQHVIAPGPYFSVYACFAAADVLLCDVSSLITDFLATGRPYGVTNPGGLSAEDFARRYPSSRGGYLVSMDGRGLESLLEAGRGGADPAASERVTLRVRLLGPADPPPLERMRAAIRPQVAVAGAVVDVETDDQAKATGTDEAVTEAPAGTTHATQASQGSQASEEAASEDSASEDSASESPGPAEADIQTGGTPHDETASDVTAHETTVVAVPAVSASPDDTTVVSVPAAGTTGAEDHAEDTGEKTSQ